MRQPSLFLKCHERFKNGKNHRYWSLAENQRCAGGRMVQRQVLYLGEINDTQRAAWIKQIELFDTQGQTYTTAALFPEDRVVPAEVPLDVLADPTLMHVVIANLVGNGIEFAAAGGGPPPTVEVRLEAREGRAEMRVSDNGRGVEESVRPRLFEPFVTSKPSGVGLGLALSRRIARAHGGDLGLERSTGGAVFLMTLPLRARPEGEGAS